MSGTRTAICPACGQSLMTNNVKPRKYAAVHVSRAHWNLGPRERSLLADVLQVEFLRSNA